MFVTTSILTTDRVVGVVFEVDEEHVFVCAVCFPRPVEPFEGHDAYPCFQTNEQKVRYFIRNNERMLLEKYQSQFCSNNEELTVFQAGVSVVYVPTTDVVPNDDDVMTWKGDST